MIISLMLMDLNHIDSQKPYLHPLIRISRPVSSSVAFRHLSLSFSTHSTRVVCHLCRAAWDTINRKLSLSVNVFGEGNWYSGQCPSGKCLSIYNSDTGSRALQHPLSTSTPHDGNRSTLRHVVSGTPKAIDSVMLASYHVCWPITLRLPS
jgi:hypothetical protein